MIRLISSIREVKDELIATRKYQLKLFVSLITRKSGKMVQQDQAFTQALIRQANNRIEWLQHQKREIDIVAHFLNFIILSFVGFTWGVVWLISKL